jgi:hypothetical protein
MGFQAAIGGVREVWTLKPIEIIGADVIPEAASF